VPQIEDPDDAVRAPPRPAPLEASDEAGRSLYTSGRVHPRFSRRHVVGPHVYALWHLARISVSAAVCAVSDIGQDAIVVVQADAEA
jgi:hypothetical protein